MIKQQCRMLVSNIRFMTGCFLAIAFTFLLIFYQERTDVRFGAGRAKCLTWALAEDKPLEALGQWEKQIYEPDFSLDSLKFSDNQFWEWYICSEVSGYIEKIYNFDTLLGEIIKQRENVKNFPDVTAGRAAVSELEAERYRSCLGSDVKAGNYMTYEKFFSFGAVDICLWGIVFLICFFMVTEEREKGIGQLVFPSAGGGTRYFLVKLLSAELMMLIAFMILFGGKLLIYGSLYGYGDMGAAIQSMDGYFGVPMRISILQYFVVFITWKLLGTAFLALLVLVICSLPLTESASGAVVFFVLWGSILLNKIIPSSSTLVMLRDCSIYQIISPEYWFTGLRSYCIGMGSQIMVISGIVLPLFCMALFGLIFLISGSYIYYSGLRKSTASEKSRQVSFFSFGKSLWWNEGYFLALQKKLLFAAAGICILFGAAVCDYDPVYNETVKFERQVVTLLNEKPFEEAHAWLLDKQAEIEDLENQVILMGQQLEEGLISKEQYNGICTLLSNQLRIKPVIQEMIAQEEDMIKCREETGIQPKYEYTSLSGQLYDESGWEQRNWIAVFIGCFVVFCAMTVFPDDRSKGIHKVLGSTPGGVRGVLSRVIWLSVMTFFLSVVMHLLWLSSLHKQYTLVGFNTPAQSWAVYRSLGLKMTVGQAVLLEICGQSLKWTLAGAAGIWISMYFANTAWAELTGLVLLVIPPVIHILGLSWFRRLPHIRSIIYGEMNVLSGMQGILWILIFGVILLIGLEKETKRWMEA